MARRQNLTGDGHGNWYDKDGNRVAVTKKGRLEMLSKKEKQLNLILRQKMTLVKQEQPAPKQVQQGQQPVQQGEFGTFADGTPRRMPMPTRADGSPKRRPWRSHSSIW